MRGKLVLLLPLLFVSGSILAQDTAQRPDNSGVNKEDRSASQPTADQAKNNRSDREIMQNIRKSIVEDKSLSGYAHNVKVISQHGRVTLKGPVRSEEERSAVEGKARDVAGAGNVDNQLTVAAPKDSSK
jgi:hyperosmotically inducible protein